MITLDHKLHYAVGFGHLDPDLFRAVVNEVISGLQRGLSFDTAVCATGAIHLGEAYVNELFAHAASRLAGTSCPCRCRRVSS